MKRAWPMVLPFVAMAIMVTGCRSLFPSTVEETKSPWSDFAEAQTAYDRVVVNETAAEELKQLGFHPEVNPNVKFLNYLDVLRQFIPNSSIRLEELPEPIRQALAAQEKCQAYELEIGVTKGRRYGNLFLDIFGFNRKTHVTGWNFKALLVLNGDRVVYKISSGQPHVNRHEQKKKPLGPLQEIDADLRLSPY